MNKQEDIMKIIAALLAIFLASVSANAQIDQKSSGLSNSHELNVNTFNLIVFGAPNITYEYLANENTSYGLSLFYNINPQDPRDRYFNPEVEYRAYSVTPFVRRYFSRKYARGFFIEGFGMLNSYDGVFKRKIIIANETISEEVVKRYTHFALGITFGGKFLMGKKGVLLETNFGMGIPGVLGQGLDGAVVRGGVSLGYRF